jgi:hypothetical protein
MPQYAIEFDFGVLDLWTLLFQKKVCLKCGSRLERQVVKESTGPK